MMEIVINLAIVPYFRNQIIEMAVTLMTLKNLRRNFVAVILIIMLPGVLAFKMVMQLKADIVLYLIQHAISS